jgi:hypothetical protein
MMMREADHLGMTSSADTLTIRRATSADAAALERLARLDSRRPTAAPHLVADAGGRLVAAVSLADGTAVADPFVPSAPAVDLLRERARQLARDERRGRVPAVAMLRGLFPATPRGRMS